jgi:hypothetical protein
MHAPKSIKQSLAIDFFLFCIDLTTLNLFSRKKNLKRGKRRKIRIEFVNPNSAFFFVFYEKKNSPLIISSLTKKFIIS